MHEMYYSTNRLPDIEIYGGETTSWEIEFLNESRTPYTGDELVGQPCSLVLVPYIYVAGVIDESAPVRVALKKTSIVQRNESGRLFATFYFSTNDTIALRGKFIYQVEVRQENQLALGHGSLFVRGNLNR